MAERRLLGSSQRPLIGKKWSAADRQQSINKKMVHFSFMFMSGCRSR